MDKIEIVKKIVLELLFTNGNTFFKALLHHFEFLLTYYDSLILWEDFVKLPGGKYNIIFIFFINLLKKILNNKNIFNEN